MWLRKPQRSGGGRGVRPWTGGVLTRTEVLQRRVAGLPCSMAAIGNGRRATVVGMTEQLLRAGRFQWAGNVTPPRLPEPEQAELDGQLRAVCATVVERFGVRGAFGVDAVWDGHHAWVLEVNPRPPASLELFGAGTFAAHADGARGLPVEWSQAPSGGKVKLVLYADRDLRAPDPAWWPSELVHDVPAAGQPLRCGAPVCTLISTGASAPELAARGARLLAALPNAVLAGA
jgi:predicted ATP-grasp superfamily ATP-dependent carboligase